MKGIEKKVCCIFFIFEIYFLLSNSKHILCFEVQYPEKEDQVRI